MERLIEALQIFIKYGNEDRPFYCPDEEFQVHGYKIEDISEEDIKKLDSLSFYWNEEEECFYSFEFGS